MLMNEYLTKLSHLVIPECGFIDYKGNRPFPWVISRIQCMAPDLRPLKQLQKVTFETDGFALEETNTDGIVLFSSILSVKTIEALYVFEKDKKHYVSGLQSQTSNLDTLRLQNCEITHTATSCYKDSKRSESLNLISPSSHTGRSPSSHSHATPTGCLSASRQPLREASKTLQYCFALATVDILVTSVASPLYES